MDAVIAYVVSGTVAASVVTPVDTRTHTAGSPITIGGGAQSIAVTPNGKTVYVPNGVLNTVTPETETTCHYFWAFVRNHRLTSQRLTTEIREGVAGIFREDEIILEAQQRAMTENPDRVFYNLNIDAGAMWARRLIDRMAAKETSPPKLQAAE